jgi:histone chaperone ASF1
VPSSSRRPTANTSILPDLEWRLIYVSSPGDEALDQELDDCLVGPIPQGVNSFEFEGSPPSASTIPKEDVLGVAALILTGSYRDQEFVRVGYYQNTEYDDEALRADPPAQILFDRLTRDISDKPRVTRFQIKWCVRPRSQSMRDIGANGDACAPQGRDAVDGYDGCRRGDVRRCAVRERSRGRGRGDGRGHADERRRDGLVRVQTLQVRCSISHVPSHAFPTDTGVLCCHIFYCCFRAWIRFDVRREALRV